MNLYTSNPILMGHESNDSYEMENQNPFPFQYTHEFSQACWENPLQQSHVLPATVNGQNQSGFLLDNGNPVEIPEIPDTCFNYISDLLREDDSDDRVGVSLHDYMAAQNPYDQSLDAALLGENFSFLANNQCPPPPVCQNSLYNCYDDYLNMLSVTTSTTDINCLNAAANHSISVNQNRMLQNIGSRTDLPLGSAGVTLAPPTTQEVVTRESEQVFDLMSNGSWKFSDSFASSLANGYGNSNELVEVVREEEQRGNMGCCNTQFESSLGQNPMAQFGVMPSNHPSSSEIINTMLNFGAPMNENAEIVKECGQCDELNDKPRGRKHGEGNEREEEEETGRSSKQSAPSNGVFEEIEQYGDVLLCPEGRSKPAAMCHSINKTGNSQNNAGSQKLQKSGMNCSKGSKKRDTESQAVDLKDLLRRCAQCVASVDLVGAYELLNQIKQHSSPYGGYLQRVAHYLANGLEARLEGKGLELTLASDQIAACEMLKANRVYVASVPFKIMSYYTANKTIARLVEEAPSIHIIDFGIFYGLQWPCIIQNLSKRPQGPPRIRITGIDFPQRGFRPAERVEETGRCLAKYCERYNVPFEYHAIAQKWETIQLEDLKIDRNEPIAVNCLYRSHNLFDESVEEHSPRDAFLKLVRKINPDMFMHGIVNSTSSVPFFLNRFKEVMYHYTALFDLFEATMSREDNERLLLESKVYGNQAMNVIACEGRERFERPETYKQWQVRTQRAGFVQVALDRELLRRSRAMVRRYFREDFSYDEDGHWVVQGWKGRILYAISCWKPQV